MKKNEQNTTATQEQDMDNANNFSAYEDQRDVAGGTQEETQTASSHGKRRKQHGLVIRVEPIRWAVGFSRLAGVGIGTVMGTIARVPLAFGTGVGTSFMKEVSKKSHRRSQK